LTFLSFSFSLSFSRDSLEQLELLLKRLLGGNGSDLRRELSGRGKEPGILKIGSSLGGSGDSIGIGSSMRWYCIFNAAMEAARAFRVV